MSNTSDINERLPRFREALEVVDNTRRRGGYEGVDSTILKYLERMEPVGLDKFGVVVPPPSHTPEDGPTVLMLHPHESETTVILPGTDAEAVSAVRIAQQAGFDDAHASKDHMRYMVSMPQSYQAFVSQRGLDYSLGEEERYILIPQLMVVSPAAPTPLLGSTLAHETDHWDFALNRSGPIQSNPQKCYTMAKLVAISEKRAYKTTGVVNQNLGRCATLASLDTIVEKYAHLPPATMGKRLYEHLYHWNQGDLDHSLAVAAITKILGRDDVLITSEEVLAMQHLQVVDKYDED